MKIPTLFLRTLAALFGIVCFGYANASDEIISLFPLENYNQNIMDWVSPSSPGYTHPVLTPAQQAMHKKNLVRHYFGDESPWSANFINFLLSQPAPNDLRALEENRIDSFTNQKQPESSIGYGENFRPYSEDWLLRIKENSQLNQFAALHYNPAKRAIAVANIQGRLLPTEDPHFYSYKLAGQGYPFDNIQASVIWAGTPVYILGETVDHAWTMVLAPSLIAWVKSTDIAKVDNAFVAQWRKAAQEKLAAITHTQVSIIDKENKLFRFSGYIGMLLPAVKHSNSIELLISVADQTRQAHIHHASLPAQKASIVPLLPTPQHFAIVMQQLLGRPYGWGSMYFYNDCASELKNFYATFGIWLPMHSTNQVNPEKALGTAADLSATEPDARRTYLMQQGHPWMTLIYVGGHVLAYIGSYPNPNDPAHTIVPLSYQNAWGLGPMKGTARRAILGGSILLPLLMSYPEDPALTPQLKKATFQLLFLDQIPETKPSANESALSVLLTP